MQDLTIREVSLTDDVLALLIALSADWEAENSCRGYRKNGRADIEGNRIFLAEAGTETVGYLFGHVEHAREASTVMPAGTPYFEIEELYVRPAARSQGVGQRLFRFAEEAVRGTADYLLLSTATKDHRAILHFYLEELGMEFWSARLFKPLSDTPVTAI